MKHDQKLLARLNERESKNALRKLEVPDGLIDFCSNDYLGFAQSSELRQRIESLQIDSVKNQVGSGASRLISANNSFVESIEQKVADFTGAKSGLLFNSGYNSNVGFFSSVPQRSDVVFYDEYIHASIRDGLKMSDARSFSFKHNSLQDLQKKVASVGADTSVFVVVESIYSMDGDSPDLTSIANYCVANDFHLIVDEAHAFGVLGDQGQGLVHQLGLQQSVYARIITFGKALGCHGAMVLGSDVLRTYLVNYARSLIYTTMMSVSDQKAIYCALDMLTCINFKNLKTSYLGSLFKQKVNDCGFLVLGGVGPVQSVVISGNEQVKSLESKIRKSGYWVKAILSPTVPEGSERIRVCFHEFNSEEQVLGLIKCFENG